MSSMSERLRQEGRVEAEEGFVARMIKAGKLALEEIAEYSGLPMARVEELAQQQS